MDVVTRSLLVSHDVENYVGIQMRREARRERRSAFGYKSWWLTLDGTAFRVKALLANRLDGRHMGSPAISPDFMPITWQSDRYVRASPRGQRRLCPSC